MNIGFGNSDQSSDLPESQNIFGKTGNGTLDFYLSKCGGNEWESAELNSLNISIWYTDLNAIYTTLLKAENHYFREMDESDNISLVYEENLNRFIFHFPELEILGTYYDMYEDYVFDTQRCSKLLRECKKIRSPACSPESDLALRKLIYGCEEALKANANLVFVCD